MAVDRTWINNTWWYWQYVFYTFAMCMCVLLSLQCRICKYLLIWEYMYFILKNKFECARNTTDFLKGFHNSYKISGFAPSIRRSFESLVIVFVFNARFSCIDCKWIFAVNLIMYHNRKSNYTDKFVNNELHK